MRLATAALNSARVVTLYWRNAEPEAPFLLARVSELTHEESRTANVALLKNNARVAAVIAQALADS